MHYPQRTSTVKSKNYFDCGYVDFRSVDGILSFGCISPLRDDRNWNKLRFKKDRNFVFAYGEGQFLPNKTYHASRGGCAFSFTQGNITCDVSQNDLAFGVGADVPTSAPIASQTDVVSSIYPTENDSSAVYIKYFTSIIVIFIISFLLMKN